MKYITMEEILFMHHRILVELQPINDDFKILNTGNLDAALSRPKQSAFGDDAYKDAYSKAAALTESLISNHPFQDGNKRVGIAAGIVFMMNNGYQLNAAVNDIYGVAINIADGSCKFDEIKEWFEIHFD